MAEDVTFGYVIQTIPRGFPDEVMADPSEATSALVPATEQIIHQVRVQFVIERNTGIPCSQKILDGPQDAT